MKHLLWLLIAGSMTIGASGAFAEDSMRKDAMDHDAMRHDSMTKETKAPDQTGNQFILRRSIEDYAMEKE